MKWFLKVRMARLAALARWMPEGNTLKVDLLVEHEILECFEALVVKTLELGPQASFNQHVVDVLVRSKDGTC
jgi:hypothetical protein